jgi:MFS family permease
MLPAKRNLLLLTPYLVCTLEGVMHGLYLVWLTVHRGVSPFAAVTAIAIGDVALLVLDVPTGIFADRLGARRSLLVGSACQVVGIALYWWARSLPVVVGAALAIAIGDAFRHGADQALVYRSCAAVGRAEAFGRLFARAQAWALAAMVGLTALGGWIAAHAGFDAAWALELALSIAGLALAWAMTDLPPRGDEPEDEEEGEGGIAGIAGLRARLPWRLIVPATIVATLGTIAQMVAQTTQLGGRGAEIVAAVIAGGLLLEALGAATVARGWVPMHARALDAIGLAAIASLALVAIAPGLLLPAVLLIFLGTGMAPAIRSGLVQARARDGERATIASAAGTLDMIGDTAVLPLAAWLYGRLHLPGMALALGVASLAALAAAARAGRGRA